MALSWRGTDVIKVYGASDDLLEIEGAIDEEFGVYGTDEDNPAYLTFSDGTAVSCVYDSDGIWRMRLLSKGSSFISKDECVEETQDNHSDIVWLGDDVKWVILGSQFARATSKKESK